MGTTVAIRRGMAALAVHTALAAASLRAGGVTTDGTVGPARTLAGPAFAVTPDLGRQVGPNLFHSFARFDLAAGESATFSGPASLRNVLARVTGGTPSQIDGTIRSTIDGADVYLVNPAGVVFGPGAALDVRGSFTASTADVVRLAGGGAFDARGAPAAGDVLTAADPASFGFLGPSPAGVTVDRSTLRVPDGRALSIASGQVRIVGATLTAPGGGGIAIVAAGGAGNVGLNRDPQALGPGPTDPSHPPHAPVELVEGARLDADGAGGGRIAVFGSDITVTGSTISARTTGAADGGGVTLDAAGRLTATASAISTDTTGTGRGGSIRLAAAELSLERAESTDPIVSAAARGGGPGGAVHLEAGSVYMRNGAFMLAGTGGTAAGGEVVISARGEVVIDGGETRRATGVLSVAGGGVAQTGAAGDVRVVADSLRLVRGGFVSTRTFSRGDAADIDVAVRGDLVADGEGVQGTTGLFSDSRVRANEGDGGSGGSIRVDAQSLFLLHGGRIASETWGTGPAGDLTLAARDAVVMDGGAGGIVTPASSESFGEGVSGSAGRVHVEAGSVLIARGATLRAATQGTGAAGALSVVAKGSLRIDDSGVPGSTGLVADSFGAAGAGTAGQISVRAGRFAGRGANVSVSSVRAESGGAVDIVVAGPMRLRRGSIVAAATGATEIGGGSAGSVRVTAGELRLSSGSVIGAQAFSGGTAGDVEIVVGGEAIVAGKGSGLDGFVNGPGTAGSVRLSAGKALTVRGGADIFAGAVDGRSGDVVLSAGTDLILDGMSIVANSTAADGGNLVLRSRGSLRVTGSFLTTQAGLDGGRVLIATPVVAINRTIVDARAAGSPVDIDVSARAFLQSVDSAILTDRMLDVPEVDLAGSLAPLRAGFVRSASPLQVRCDVDGRSDQSVFRMSSRGGEPVQPGGPQAD